MTTLATRVRDVLSGDVSDLTKRDQDTARLALQAWDQLFSPVPADDGIPLLSTGSARYNVKPFGKQYPARVGAKQKRKAATGEADRAGGVEDADAVCELHYSVYVRLAGLVNSLVNRKVVHAVQDYLWTEEKASGVLLLQVEILFIYLHDKILQY